MKTQLSKEQQDQVLEILIDLDAVLTKINLAVKVIDRAIRLLIIIDPDSTRTHLLKIIAQAMNSILHHGYNLVNVCRQDIEDDQ